MDKIKPDMTTYCVQNLTTGSDYFFRVMAENKAGPSPPLEMDKPVRIKSPFGELRVVRAFRVWLRANTICLDTVSCCYGAAKCEPGFGEV